VDFLEQLSTALPSTELELEQVLRKETKTSRKLELRLADRKQVSNDGYACELYVLLSMSTVPRPQNL